MSEVFEVVIPAAGVKTPEKLKKGERFDWWPPQLGGKWLVESEHLYGIAADPTRTEDMKLLSKWFGDEELGKWMEASEETELERDEGTDKAELLAQSFSEDYHNEQMKHGAIYIVFKEKTTNEAIGFGAIYEWCASISRAEISFMIGEEKFRGKGFGKEVVGSLCRFSFEKMKALSLFSSVVLENIPSKKAMERCGFTDIGIRHRAHSFNGVLHDEMLMECFPESYLSLPFASTIHLVH